MVRLPLNGCEVDVDRRIVYRDESTTRLTTREAELLQYLAARPGTAITREELLHEVWGYGPRTISRAVDDTMKRLRPKVELDPKNPLHLITVHGAGYRFEPVRGQEPVALAPLRRSNLGEAANRFVGRAADLAAIDDLLESSHLVSLVGPGGTGKTRLACHFGRRQREAYSGGVWFVDLSEATSAGDIRREVALTLGLDPAHVDARLGERGPALYILDNFEQVVDHAPETLGGWISAHPEARFLVTTRERLRIPGEAILNLRPLTEPEAVELFIERAGPDLSTPADAETLREIVRRVDQLPLAIELSAARVGLLGLQGLLDRLQDRFQVLSGGFRGAQERHATLWKTIAWSWQLLRPDEQRGLAQCAVFRGGFTIEAAEAILDIDSDVLSVLQELLNKSMLTQAPSHHRLGFYESIRRFAEAQLEASGQAEETARRHAAYFASWANRQPPMPIMELVAARSPEAENLLVAVQRTTEPQSRARLFLALDPLLQMRGPLHRREALLESLDLTALAPDSTVRILLARAEVRGTTGRWDQARADLERALELTHDLASLRAHVMSHLGVLEKMRGQNDAAEAWLRRGLAIEDIRAPVRALLSSNLAATHIGTGRIDEAEALLRTAIRQHQSSGDRRALAFSQLNLADVEIMKGRPDEAEALLITAVDVFRELGDARRIPAIARLSLCALERGDLDAAEQPLLEAHTWATRSGQAFVIGETHLIDGVVSIFRDRPHAAETSILRSMDAYTSAGMQLELAEAQLWHCVIHTLTGNPTLAASQLSEIRARHADEEHIARLSGAVQAVLQSSRGEDPEPLIQSLDRWELCQRCRLLVKRARRGH